MQLKKIKIRDIKCNNVLENSRKSAQNLNKKQGHKNVPKKSN